MAFRLRPLFDRVLVRRDPEKTESEGGIAFADQFLQPAHRGTVLAVGTGRLMDNGDTVPLVVKVDDRIVFGRHGGITLPEDLGMGKDLVIMREDEVTAIDDGEVAQA